MNVTLKKADIDIFNYFSLELLEQLGEFEPTQATIDMVATLLEKFSDITNKNCLIEPKIQRAH